ncbi:EAL domain-containing protein [Marinicella sediminis]|uniref:EAL domain-containing protein n=1 Tax=Marinicella sediminis TaxID=1792834 RepID=A0ABV7JC63_9GAMM|nr:GGDEF domain-containing phosphodiesterase [Marinicella sediminis]
MVVVVTVMVTLFIAARGIYQYTTDQHIDLLDDQLKLWSEHNSLDNLLHDHSPDVQPHSPSVTPDIQFPVLQSFNPAGLLIIEHQHNQPVVRHWFPVAGNSVDPEPLLQDLMPVLARDNPHGMGLTFRRQDQSYRALLIDAAAGRQAVLLARQSVMVSDYVVLLLWMLVIIVLVSVLIYLVHVLIYQKRRKRWLNMIKNAKIDPLTGLPNQHQLQRDLKHARHTNLAFIKFHNFNSILNTYGPAITDDVIRQISAVIAGFSHPLSKNGTCYHVQQAVFATLEDQQISYEKIAQLTKDLVTAIMTTRYEVGDGEYISVNVTVGAVRQNRDAFMLANMALQEAERKNLQFYLIDEHDSWLPETYRRDLALTQVLLEGLKEDRIVAYYQPIFCARTKQVVKYECLSRLIGRDGEVELMPNVFIPLAHRANVYAQITKAMIRQAISLVEAYHINVSLNLSVSDIHNRRTCEYLFHKLKSSGLGQYIQIELLENEAIIETDDIIEFIGELKSIGCRVGMDDLGKGHSNIERLINLPIDYVKIDRSIMENVTHNLEMQNVARGIVKLAHKKGLEVVAEYCSTRALTQLAIDLGVDYLQGFYLGKPGPYEFEVNADADKPLSSQTVQ